MNSLPLVVTTAALGLAVAWLWQRQRSLQRERHIRSFDLPRGLFERLRKRRPELTAKDCQLVAHALRQFFLTHLKSGRRYVSMPSQIVDELWHEFILYTKHYERFCRQAFGRFLHHTPAVVLGSERTANAGLRRCFWWACLEEHINPRQPTRLPLLFAIDAKLGIADGFRYVPDCRRPRAEGDGGGVYCGGDFADAGIDGSCEGWGGESSGGDGGGGNGGGDGGSGCGGGGCGGGE